MANLAFVRKTALSLPGAVEVDWYGAPMFNVGKKTFVFLSRSEQRWVFKLPPARQDFLFAAEPRVFQPWRTGAMEWAYVDIAALKPKDARLFMIEAWSTIVPKKISRPYLEAHAPELITRDR